MANNWIIISCWFICSTSCSIFIVSPLNWGMWPLSVGASLAECLDLVVCAYSVSVYIQGSRCLSSLNDQKVVSPCLNHCQTTIGRSRFLWEALPGLKMSRIWSKTSTGTSTLPWWRTEMLQPKGIITLRWLTLSETTWLAGGSAPSSTTMRKILK